LGEQVEMRIIEVVRCVPESIDFEFCE
jgi:hypothetical protein